MYKLLAKRQLLLTVMRLYNMLFMHESLYEFLTTRGSFATQVKFEVSKRVLLNFYATLRVFT